MSDLKNCEYSARFWERELGYGPKEEDLMKWSDFSALVEKYGMAHDERIYVNHNLTVVELIEAMKDGLKGKGE